MNLIQLDYDIFFLINHLYHSPSLDIFFIFIDIITRQGVIYIIIVFIFYLMRKTESNKFAFLACTSMLFTYVLNTIIFKNLFDRGRPIFELSGVVLVGLNPSTYAFPSGHTAIAFAFFTSCYIIFQRKTITYIAFFFALLVGFDRIYMGHHYPSDVLGGAIIGTIATIIVYKVTQYLKSRKFLTFKEKE